MTDALEATDRARLRFLLDIAHRLRTPAGVIAGYVEMLREGDITLEEALPALEAETAELTTTLEAMLGAASATLEQQERWSARLSAARAENQRVMDATQRLVEASRRLLTRAAEPPPPPPT